MTANQWREKTREAAAAVELALPSGMTIRARRPDALQFAEWKMLPLALARAAELGPANVSDEEATEIAGLMRELLIYCCLEPAVSLTPGENGIHPREIPDTDWMFIVAWAMRLREADTLRPFRRERKTATAARDSQAVFVQTVGAAGDRGSGAGTGVRPGGGAEGDGAAKGSD
jgi:hypothetical protein